MSKMLACVHNDVHAPWKSYFVNARMIGEWRESLIIHTISDRVTPCRWVWVVARRDVVVDSVMERHLRNLLYSQTFDSVVKD